MGMIFSGLYILIAVAALFMGGITTQIGGGEAAVMLGISGGYLLIGLLMLWPSIKLMQYGMRIARLLASSAQEDLVSALEAQRIFWKIVGILCIISVALTVAIIAAAAIIPLII